MEKYKVDDRIAEVLIDNTELQIGIQKAADWINENYENKELIIISVLKGSIVFLGNLMPKITVDFMIDLISASSFKGEVKAVCDPEIHNMLTTDLKGKHVLLIEDIIDSARTIKKIIDMLSCYEPLSVKLLTMLDKPDGRNVDVDVDFACFKIPLKFIVGFGLDFQEKMRNLPYIGVLKKEMYFK